MAQNKTDTPWTPKVVKAFLALLNDKRNFTYEQIARRLTVQTGIQFNKNSCIGKGRRLNVPPRTGIPYQEKTGPIDVEIEVVLAPKLVPAPAPVGRLTINQLDYDTCRYPFGDRPPLRYCGKKTEDGGSYCPDHAAACFVAARR